MLLKIAGRVRGLFAGNYPENREDEQMHLNTRGEMLTALGLPELTEIVRLGGSWQVASTTGQASLTALPTTTAGLTIYNGYPATGPSLIIDSAAYWEAVVDATQSDQTAFFAMLNKRNATAPSAGTVESGVASLSGVPNYGGSVVARRGATVQNDGWFPLGSSPNASVTAVAGAVWKASDVPLRGLYIVTPGSAFSVQTAKVAAAAAAQFFAIRWHEAQLAWKP